MRRTLRAGLTALVLLGVVAVGGAGAADPPPAARTVRTWERRDVAPSAALLGVGADGAYGALGPLAAEAETLEAGTAPDARAVLLVAREASVRGAAEAQVRAFVESGGVVFVDAWAGDATWLASLAGGDAAAADVVRDLTTADPLLAAPHALPSLPPSHSDPDPTLVGVVARGEIRVVATRQDTLCHGCSCDKAAGQRRFGENLARHAIAVASRSRPKPPEPPLAWGAASLEGRRFRAEATVRNDGGRDATAWLRLLPREGAPVAEVSVPAPAETSVTVVLETEVPFPFDVVEHRLVVSREDAESVDRRIAPLLDLVGAPDLVVLHTGTVVPGVPASVRAFLWNSKSRAPYDGMPFDLALGHEGVATRAVAHGKTDSAGSVSVAVAAPEEPFTKAAWTASAGTPLGREEVVSATRGADPRAGHLFLDVPVHRPGDVVKFRLLVLRRPSGRAVAGETVEVWLSEKRSETFLKSTVTTDARGVATGEFRLPETAATGDYEISAGSLARGTLRIERFEVPRFRVAIDPAPRSLRPGGHVEGVVAAGRFDGAQMPGASVSVRIRTSDLAAPPLAKWEGVTDAAGRAAFRVDVRHDAVPGPDGAQAFLDVAVRDAGGRTVRETVRLAWMGERASQATAHAPDGGLVPGRAGTVLVRTDLAPGSDVATRVGAGVPQRAVVDDLGFVEVQVPAVPAPAGAPAGADVSTIEVGGREVTAPVARGDVILSVGRRIVAAGAPVPVRVVVRTPADAAFVDVLWSGAILATHRLRVVEGIAAGELVLPAAATGHVVLQAYVRPERDAFECDAAGVFVVPPETLRMSITPSAAEVRPGATVDLDVRVTDAAGRGAPAVFALRVVDEAVLSLVARPMDVARVALAVDRAILRAQEDVPGPTIQELAADSARRPLTRGESRLADVLVSRADVPVAYEVRARSLPSRREAHATRVDEQFAAFANDFVRRATEVLAGDLVPAPSAEVPDVVAALRAAAARGAFGLDGLLDPWGTPLGFGEFVDLPFDYDGGPVSAATEYASLRLRSPGPNGAFDRRVRRSTSLFEEGEDEPDAWPEDAEQDLPFADTLALHAAWVGRHGHTFRAAEFATNAPVTSWGGRSGGSRSLRAGGGGRRSQSASPADDAAPRPRRFFPEAIVFAPLVETDAEGRARVPVKTPDSVTTWRADAVAHGPIDGGRGGVGQADARFRTTLPFTADPDVPPSLFSGDEVAIPVVLRWTEAARSDVVADASVAGPLELLSDARTTLRPGPSGEAVLFVRVRAAGSGTARLTVRCASGGATDAVEREIEVLAPGRAVAVTEAFRSATGRATAEVRRPDGAIPGTERLELRLRGGPLDDVLDGTAGLLRTPHGCFEQASSTTFPNILALSLLDGSERMTPALRARFDAAIARGTDLLLSYEIEGGGFDWFGHPPAKLLLSAYGAQEWWMLHKLRRSEGREGADGEDRAGAVALRTSRWIVRQQREDGSFPAEGVPYEWRGQASGDLAATAYVGWSLAPGRRWDDAIDTAVAKSRAWVAAHVGACEDPYALAIATVFLAETGTGGGADDPAAVAASRLAARVQRAGGRAWLGGGLGSAFHGRGTVAGTEATALAALAAARLPSAKGLPREELLAGLAAARRADGTWGTTQATVLALWAFADRKDEEPPAGTVFRVSAGPGADRDVTIDSGAGATVVDLAAAVARPSPWRVSVDREGGGLVAGALTFSCVVPWAANGEGEGDVRATRTFPTTAKVGQPFEIPVSIVSRRSSTVALPIVVVPMPAGVLPDEAALRTRRLPDRIVRIETDAERVVLYLRELPPGETVACSIPAVPRLRGCVTVAPAEARPYYEPDAATWSPPATLTID